jgi:hypothetical protein
MDKEFSIIENFPPPHQGNSQERVEMRQIIMESQKNLAKAIEDGQLQDISDQGVLTHYFTPIHEQYGCCAYARKLLIPKRSVTFGAIHRHPHLNFLLKGRLTVFTEAGKAEYQAGDIFVSEVGAKRVFIAQEESLWATVHLTKYGDETHLDDIEEELITKTYEELGLISTMSDLDLRRAIEDFTATLTEEKE